MTLGIGTYCYVWAMGVEGAVPATPLSPLGLLDEAERLGVRLVQYGPNRPLHNGEVDAVADRARERGIELELGMAGLALKEVERQLHLCRRLGAKLLRTVNLYEGSAPDAANFERELRTLLPLLEEYGVRLGVENARIPAELMAQVLDEISSPWLGITLDTVNSLAIPEGTEEVVRQLARHTICLHIKDFEVKRIWHMMGFTVEGAAAGAGQLDVPCLLEELRRAGRDPNAILELWVPQQKTVEETIALERRWAEESVAYLRRLIPE